MSDARHPKKLVAIAEIATVESARQLGQTLKAIGFTPRTAIAMESRYDGDYIRTALIHADGDPSTVQPILAPEHPITGTAAECALYTLGLTRRADTRILAVVPNVQALIVENSFGATAMLPGCEPTRAARLMFAEFNGALSVMALCQVKELGREGRRSVRLVGLSSLLHWAALPDAWGWIDPEWINDFPPATEEIY